MGSRARLPKAAPPRDGHRQSRGGEAWFTSGVAPSAPTPWPLAQQFRLDKADSPMPEKSDKSSEPPPWAAALMSTFSEKMEAVESRLAAMETGGPVQSGVQLSGHSGVDPSVLESVKKELSGAAATAGKKGKKLLKRKPRG